MIGRRAACGLALAFLPGVARATTGAFATEIVVRTVNNLRRHADVVALVESAARHGVGTINLAAKQDEDDEIASGLVFYASRIAPRAPGYEAFDALAETVAEAHRLNIRVRAWVPQFHDQAVLRVHPDWQMHAAAGGKASSYSGRGHKEFFLNPLDPSVQAYQRSLLVEIARRYDVDGIVVDWVRFDDYNMDVGPATRARYRKISGADPLDIDFTVDSPARAQWNDFRTAEIAAYIKSVRAAIDAVKPGLTFGVYVLPPAFVEVAQDIARFASDVTFLSPMAYFKDWGFAPRWVDASSCRRQLPRPTARPSFQSSTRTGPRMPAAPSCRNSAAACLRSRRCHGSPMANGRPKRSSAWRPAAISRLLLHPAQDRRILTRKHRPQTNKTA